MDKDKKMVIYGLSEDPWPYEYLINALIFFSMSTTNRESYFSTIEENEKNKYGFENAKHIIIEAFSENLIPGRNFDDWNEDIALDKLEIEKDFPYFSTLGFMSQPNEILNHWELVRTQTLKILNKLGWEEADAPFFSSQKILEWYKNRDEGNGWGWHQ